MFRLFAFLFLLLSLTLIATEPKEADPEKFSEALGHIIGKNLSDMGIDLDVKKVIKGIKNGVDNKESPMTEEECMKNLNILQQKVQEKISEKNLKQAVLFLQNNLNDKEIVELEKEKLQYKILSQGSGKTVAIYNAPLVRYIGKYINGDKFITMEERVALNEIIPGFGKGLIGMKEGEKREIFIHPDLGFGKNGPNPNSLLIFEVELIKAEAGAVNISSEIANKQIR